MASGGRRSTTWEKGKAIGAGRKPGSKDEVPRSFKASVRAVYEKICNDRPDLIEDAVIRGLQARKPRDAHAYVRLAAELWGELKQQVELSGGVEVTHGVIEDVTRELERLAAKSTAGDVEPPEVAE